MMDFELGAVQERFADIVWANEPVGSGELVKICEKELNWKKPTTSCGLWVWLLCFCMHSSAISD